MGCPKRHVSVAMEPIVWQLYDRFMNENIRISIPWQHLDTTKFIRSSSMFNSILQLLLRIYVALFYVCKYFASMFICVTWVPATAEVRRQHQIPQIAFTGVLSHVTTCARTQVLCKSSKYLLLLISISFPLMWFLSCFCSPYFLFPL